jgi:septum formation protein
MHLILASTSIYRRQLLARLGLPFETRAPGVDEAPLAGEAPAAQAARLARAKARAVADDARVARAAVVIGSDQVATLDGIEPLGKPGTFERARRQLQAASGRTMQFHTSFAVIAPGTAVIEETVTIVVRFRRLDDDEIDRYLALEQPFDCAGAARSEGLGIALLESIVTDDPTALIGLPLIRVAAALRAVGLDPLGRR